MKSEKSNKYPFEEAAGMLKVVAHPVKLFIISLLEGKSMKVGDIRAAVGAKQSVISQHLNAMASKGILGRERKGNEVFYYIRKKEVLKMLTCIKGCCEK
jgi:DNA-binding transcriptional ArsR family regulator